MYNHDGDKSSDINIRIGKESYAFNCWNKVWKEDRISLATKIKLLIVVVISVLLYGCKSWKGLREIKERMGRLFSEQLLKENYEN